MIEVIAEIAQGYLGQYNSCKTYIEASAKAGATSIKFQLVYADELCTKDYKHYKLFKSLELNFKSWFKLKKIADKNKLNMYFDIFGNKSLSIAKKLNIKGIKVHPTDLTNNNLLIKIKKSGLKKIIIGIGGSNKDHIISAVRHVQNNKNQICLMHGFQGYPTLLKDNELNRIIYLRNFFNKNKNISFGFADHTLPNSPNSHLASVLAVGLGCSIIEKHITISKILKIEDYESAYNPDEFYDFVSIIKDCQQIINTKNLNKFKLNRKEIKYSSAISRNYISKKKILKNSILNENMFDLKRSPNPKALKHPLGLKGKVLKKNIKKNFPLMIGDI